MLSPGQPIDQSYPLWRGGILIQVNASSKSVCECPGALRERMTYAPTEHDRACRRRCDVCYFCGCTGVGPIVHAPLHAHSRFGKRRHSAEKAAILDPTLPSG